MLVFTHRLLKPHMRSIIYNIMLRNFNTLFGKYYNSFSVSRVGWWNNTRFYHSENGVYGYTPKRQNLYDGELSERFKNLKYIKYFKFFKRSVVRMALTIF